MASRFIKQRHTELALEIADGLIEGEDRLMNHGWLVENAVTLDETLALTGMFGRVMKGFLKLPPEMQMVIMVAGADEDCSLDAGRLVSVAQALAANRRVIEELKGV